MPQPYTFHFLHCIATMVNQSRARACSSDEKRTWKHSRKENLELVPEMERQQSGASGTVNRPLMLLWGKRESYQRREMGEAAPGMTHQSGGSGLEVHGTIPFVIPNRTLNKNAKRQKARLCCGNPAIKKGKQVAAMISFFSSVLGVCVCSFNSSVQITNFVQGFSFRSWGENADRAKRVTNFRCMLQGKVYSFILVRHFTAFSEASINSVQSLPLRALYQPLFPAHFKILSAFRLFSSYLFLDTLCQQVLFVGQWRK